MWTQRDCSLKEIIWMLLRTQGLLASDAYVTRSHMIIAAAMGADPEKNSKKELQQNIGWRL